MYFSYKFIKESLPAKKNGRSSLWVRWFIRKLSFPLTYLFINAGWTANGVSLLSWVIIFIASFCLCINNVWFRLIGVLLTNFWLVLDCVDGNIARCKKIKTFMGDFYDAVAGYGPFAFTTIGLGMAAFYTSKLTDTENAWIWILIAAVGSMSNIYTRLIHQKYLVCFFAAKSAIGESEDINLKDTDDKKSFAYIREQIDKNIGVSGLFMPWLFFAFFTDTFDVMLSFYTFYYIVSFCAIIFLYIKKASIFEKEVQIKLKFKQ